MLKALFHWLDGHPGSYWLIVAFFSLLWLAWTGWSFRSDSTGRPARRHGWITAILLLATLLAWRWPPLFNPREYNPDESQLIAGAITLTHDPVFWRSVDGTTSGPLNFYALLPTHWLGVPQDYFNARLTGLLLVWGSLWCGYWIVRSAYGASVGVLGLLPGLAFYAVTTDRDFLHYSSEHVSIFLLMLAAVLLRQTDLSSRPGVRRPRGCWLAAGFCLGLLPWAKLQSIPPMLVLAAWATALAWWRADCSWEVRRRDFFSIVAVALLPSLAVALGLTVFGQWYHFYNSYILNNINYVGRGFEIPGIVRHMWQICALTYTFNVFPIGPVCIILGAGGALLFRHRWPQPVFGVGAALTVLAFSAALAPRQAYPHYLLFTVLPLTWWSAAALGELLALAGTKRQRAVLSTIFLFVSVGGLAIARARLPVPAMYGQFAESWRKPYEEEARIIRQLSRPGDTLAVWGWDCQIYVQCGLAQATREAHSTRQLWDSPQIDTYYRPRYMADLEKNQPAFFYDAVGIDAFFFQDRARYANETYPPLRDYVFAHYVFYRDFGYGRLFVRTDRVPPDMMP